ncbi:cysteine desulfurase family protein, partial [Laedolimicola sp.]|uniref:cysteine desulfurase family protein n=1 Tax=Laedolimicola sp. TaxID=2981663 RepID=UPI003F7D08B2
MEVYLDNSATTRCFPEAAKLMYRVMTEDYGNPSSLHQKGVDAEKYVREAKEIIAKNLKVEPKEIYFTSGGTESDNLALMGAAHANQRAGKHLITTRIEHPAILNTMKELEKQGFQVTYLPVDEQGVVRIADLEAALTDETILVSVMYVNNEIGAVQPIEEIGKLLKNREKPILFHVDAVQGYGKFRILPKKLGIDMLSVSGHKIHGPKGMGILYVDEHVKIHPILFGGGQQRDLRSGTENVPGIAGLGEAVKEIYTDFNEKMERLYGLREYFVEEIEKIEGTIVNGPKGREGAPHIVSVSFAGVRSEVLLHSLEDKGIYVSSGSACASNHPAVSETLKAIHVKKELLDSTIRFSFSDLTTKEELDYAADIIADRIQTLRKFTRRK